MFPTHLFLSRRWTEFSESFALGQGPFATAVQQVENPISKAAQPNCIFSRHLRAIAPHSMRSATCIGRWPPVDERYRGSLAFWCVHRTHRHSHYCTDSLGRHRGDEASRNAPRVPWVVSCRSSGSLVTWLTFPTTPLCYNFFIFIYPWEISLLHLLILQRSTTWKFSSHFHDPQDHHTLCYHSFTIFFYLI